MAIESLRSTVSASIRPLRLRYLLIGTIAMTTLVAGPGLAMAQSTPSPAENIRTITVNGTGIVTVEPDLANISIGVQNQSKSLETAQQENSTAITSVTKVLTDAEIASKDILTSSYSVYPVNKNDDNGNFVGIVGYQVNTVLSVTVRDITTVGSLLDSVVNAGANQVLNISFSVSDPAKPTSQARKAAVDDARSKADELAQASGVVVSGVVSIQETSAPMPKSQDFGAAASAPSTSSESNRQVSISPGSADLEVDVLIVFEVTAANG